MCQIGLSKAFLLSAALVALPILSCSTSCKAKSLKDQPTSVAIGGGPSITPGKWKALRTVGGPEGESRADEITWCMTKEQAADLPRAMTGGGQCTTLSQSQDGDKLTWSMECQMPEQGPKTYSKGEVVARGEKAKLDMETTVTMGAQTMTQKTSWEGKRIGPCD